MAVSSAELAAYAEQLEFEDLPEDVINRTKRVVLDTIGCALGAYTSPPSKALRSVFTGRGADATVLGSGMETSVEYATLINSALARYLDYNDTYLREGRAIHPSDHIPALIAVGEATGATGKELIEAVVLAYEIEGAGRDTGELYGTGFDYVTWGALSCSIASGKLMGLSEEELIDAVGIAGTSSVALGIARRDEVSMWKGIAHGYVNHNAVQACVMAREGITGPTGLFEGTSGFFEAITGESFDLGPFGGQGDQPYRITQTNIKPYPCGYYMQSAVEAALEIREDDVDPSDIESVTVRTFEQPVDVLAGPEKWSSDLTRETADHSIPYTVAVALIAGEVTPEQYGRTYLEDDRVHALMQKIEVEESADLNEFVEEHDDSLPMDVTVETETEAYRTRIDYPEGHATRPLTEEQLEAKFQDMALELLTEKQVRQTFAACYGLDDLESVTPLLDNLVV